MATDPLVQFFELVHVGDMILQIIDVYYRDSVVSESARLKQTFFLALHCR
jgi:hypothetical protein